MPKKRKYIGFKELVDKLKNKPGIRNPKAVAAAVGRKKYGKKKFQKAAAQGKSLRRVKPRKGY